MKDLLELARQLLDDPDKYSEAKIDEIIKSEETKNVYLKEPLEVMLTYLNVHLDIDGNVLYSDETYSLDPIIIEKLKTPISKELR